MASSLEFIKELLRSDKDIFSEENETEHIKDALAILISHVIVADGIVTQQERSTIFGFFELEFEMNKKETQELFNSILENMHEFEKHIDTLNQAIQHSEHARFELLRHLNNIIICDGCKDVEYDLYEKIIKSL